MPWQLQHVSRAFGTDLWDTNFMTCPWLKVVPCLEGLLSQERAAEGNSRTHSISKTNPHFKAKSVFVSEGKQLNSSTAALMHETTLFSFN